MDPQTNDDGRDSSAESIVGQWSIQQREQQHADASQTRSLQRVRTAQLLSLGRLLSGADTHGLEVQLQLVTARRMIGHVESLGSDFVRINLGPLSHAIVALDAIIDVRVTLDTQKWSYGDVPSAEDAGDASLDFRIVLAEMAESAATVAIETVDGRTQRLLLWNVSDELVSGVVPDDATGVRHVVAVAIQSVAVVLVSG
jgi:hypothetical protein